MANPRWLEDWSEQEARRLQAQEWGGGSSSGTSSPERGGYHDEGQGSHSRYDRAPPRRTGRSLNDRRHDYGYDSYDSEYDSRSGSFAFSSPGNGRYSRDPSNGRRGNNRRTSLPRRRDFSDDHRDDYYVDGSDDGYSDRSRAPSSYYSSRSSSPARRGNRPPTRRRQHSRSPPRDRSPSAYRFPRDADTWGRGGGPSRSNGRYGGRSPNPTSAIPESIEFKMTNLPGTLPRCEVGGLIPSAAEAVATSDTGRHLRSVPASLVRPAAKLAVHWETVRQVHPGSTKTHMGGPT